MSPRVPKDRSADAAPPCPGTGRAPRILIAEDDSQMRDLLAEALRGAGYMVWEAEDGMELFDYYDEQSAPGNPDQFQGVDLIVSDIRMPWITGMQILGELRARRRHIPVVLITAFGDEKIHADAERLGAVAVFDKPFDVGEFLAFLGKFFSEHGIPTPKPAP
jgi:CheY-like chemotaxis protein